jgi:hypothetical protein
MAASQISRLCLAGLGLALAATTSCASGADIDGPITYVPTGGFSGRGDGSTELRVEPDGTLSRPGPSGGSQRATLERATLDDLHRKVLAAEFPGLQSFYACSCADDFVYAIGVQISGMQYSVQAHELAPPPPRLRIVIDTFHDIGELPLDWH